jgi:dTDP-4-amino-4,6-dideoxygalactose transaminase
MVPFLDLKRSIEGHRDELIAALTEVVDSGWYILGKKLEKFEREYATFTGAKHAIGTGNGLEALSLIIRSYRELGVFREGDEILVPANTYIASILAVTENRLVPVLVEPDLKTYNINPELLEEKITPRTKGILTVHLYGQVAYSEKMQDTASRSLRMPRSQ